MLGLVCQVAKGVFSQIAPCLEHVCAGGGSVGGVFKLLLV